MSRSTVNVKRRRKRTKGKQAVIHGVQRSVMLESKQQSGLQSGGSTKKSAKQRKEPEEKAVIKASLTPLATMAHKDKKSHWKPVFEQYITRYNQAEIDQHSERLNEYTLDQLHNERVDERLQRLRERDLYRGAHVAGSELKAEIVSINDLEQEVVLNVKYHLTRKISQDGKQYTEERLDQERLWLIKDHEEWKISRVEPIVPERKPRHGGVVQDWTAADQEAVEEEPAIARPYLNPELMSQFRYIRATNRYRREQAVAYADAWWNKPNPNYEEFEANCTNYVSQCLFAGEAPMLYTNRRDNGWWYKGRGPKGKEWWSYSWAVSRSLAAFLSKTRSSGLRAVEVNAADQLELGDIIVYDWNGNNSFQHTTIVTAFDSKGQPLVNANTNASRHRFWDYQDSYAWTPNTRYRFFHISDFM